MKLLRAKFENFRLLRDLELEFSSDPRKKLTVVRAANESGKTTILHGLQWALYGDLALPGRGEGFRLHPIDWDVDEHKRVPIVVTVEFEVTTYRQSSGKLRERRQRYRLVRSAFEDVDSESRRTSSTVKLFALTDTGADSIDAPDSKIRDELPPELREVFFTDGDRALSFIEANVAASTKRERVQRAIRSLLGLGVIGDATRHVRKSLAEVNKKAEKVGSGSELKTIASRLSEMENDREQFEDELEDAIQQFEAFGERLDEIDREIGAVLQQGDKEQFQEDIENTKDEMRKLDDQLIVANREHSELFGSQSIATGLLAPIFTTAFTKLEELHDQGKIPKTTIPVLQDRLEAEVCICGESLEAGKSDSDKRRAHIQKLIDNNRRPDEMQEIITRLYFSTKSLEGEGDSYTWFEDYEKVVKRREGIQELRDQAGRKFRALELKLDGLPDTDIQGLRKTRSGYKDQRDRHLEKQSRLKTQLEALQNEREGLEQKRDRLLREEEKGARVLAGLEVTKDVQKVLESAYEQITNEELQKVSELMNKIFLEMIGADPEQGSIIQRAKISREFEITVYGPNNRTLNPDQDLNGASRRALTLAFILALTKVSEVEAPNVIDTPLGMTSGFVKHSILRTAVRESAQLILFLTHDEIIGCEEIIDEFAGTVFTLTNPAHYPKMLVNDPRIVERKVFRCECTHRQECPHCKRRKSES